MANFYYTGMVPMLPELDKVAFNTNDDTVCGFKVPPICYGVMSEKSDESVYDWRVDSLVMTKNQYVMVYVESTFNEVLLKNLDGEKEWVNGKVADIVGIDIGGREDVRVAKEYFVDLYDFEKGEKKKGKVVFEDASPMSEYEFSEFGKFCTAGSY